MAIPNLPLVISSSILRTFPRRQTLRLVPPVTVGGSSKISPTRLLAPDRLITVEECTPGGGVFHQRGDRVTLAPQRQGDILLECKPEALAALSIVHRSLRRTLDRHTQTGG
jgi:hypothetical protein